MNLSNKFVSINKRTVKAIIIVKATVNSPLLLLKLAHIWELNKGVRKFVGSGISFGIDLWVWSGVEVGDSEVGGNEVGGNEVGVGVGGVEILVTV